MILTKLDISNFRNIKTLQLLPHRSLNLVTGNNGSGKSTLLETIQCLSTGHSFRTRKYKELISRHQESYRITSVFTDPLSDREHRAGLERRSDGGISLRLDYDDIKSQSEITRLLPIKTLTPDSHRLIQEGPDERRQFLDWGLFHVEPAFLSDWRDFRRSLSQRNQLLRDSASDKDIETWNIPFIASSVQLNMARLKYVEKFDEALQLRIAKSHPEFHVELQYRSGWDQTKDLELLLRQNLNTHRKMKTTTDGPHRADLAIKTDGILAKQLLSRGQQKTLVYLLHLAQLDVLHASNLNKAIVLCDDLTSELDLPNSRALIEQLLALDSQIFVTGVDLNALIAQNNEMFHMERGELKKRL